MKKKGAGKKISAKWKGTGRPVGQPRSTAGKGKSTLVRTHGLNEKPGRPGTGARSTGPLKSAPKFPTSQQSNKASNFMLPKPIYEMGPKINDPSSCVCGPLSDHDNCQNWYESHQQLWWNPITMMVEEPKMV